MFKKWEEFMVTIKKMTNQYHMTKYNTFGKGIIFPISSCSEEKMQKNGGKTLQWYLNRIRVKRGQNRKILKQKNTLPSH